MEGYDKTVYEKTCSSGSGHYIASVVIAKAIDPKTNVVHEEMSTYCVKCGMSLTEIRSFSKKRAPRKAKEEVPA